MTSSLFHKTNSLVEIVRTSQLQGRTEGRVYSTPFANRLLSDHATQTIEFTGSAAGLFVKHPVRFSAWGMFKRYLRQEMCSSSMGDIAIIEAKLVSANHLVISSAEITPLRGRLWWLAWARLCCRWLMLEPITMIGFGLLVLWVALDQNWTVSATATIFLTWFAAVASGLITWWFLQDRVYRWAAATRGHR
jgi:hypothetical protein